ncbi:hypothetical protein SprV_0602151300 [Sparganum proliferum]
MSHDTHSSYIYERLPQLIKQQAAVGFSPYSSSGTMVFPSTLSLRNISHQGRFFQDVPSLHERQPLEMDYNVHCRYFKLEDPKVPTVDKLSSSDFYRMRAFKQRNKHRREEHKFPNAMQRHCAGCCAINVGGTIGCDRRREYGHQDSDGKLPKFETLPMAPYGRGKYQFFYEILDRSPTNHFWDSRKHV